MPINYEQELVTNYSQLQKVFVFIMSHFHTVIHIVWFTELPIIPESFCRRSTVR